jgi:hypothetical protein
MGDPIVQQTQMQWRANDRCPIHSGGPNAMTDSIRVLDKDLVASGAVAEHHLEASPRLWNARVQNQHITLQA